MTGSIATRAANRRTHIAAAPLAMLIAIALLPLACDRSDPPAAGNDAAASNAPADAGGGAERAVGDAASAPPALEPILDCVPKDGARPICGLHAAEDIVALPGDAALLVSGYGHLGPDGAVERPGSISLFTLADDASRILYSGGRDADAAEAGWGDPSCPAPPRERFNAHGLDLVRRDDGRLALYAVHHFGREAIEIFEVTGAGKDWSLAWKGCVLAPPDAALNDVVAFPDGEFFTTQMYSTNDPDLFANGTPTVPTGHAFAWKPGTGYRDLPGTEGIVPNGLAVSPDRKTLYLNLNMQSEVRKIDVATGKLLAAARVPMPDNTTWTPDGKRLLVASLHGLEADPFPTYRACVEMKEGACPIPFAIQALDPETMAALGPVYESTGAPMGAGTVGLQVGDELFVGASVGDRILRVALAKR